MYGNSGIPDNIRQSLAQYKRHKLVLCLGCGYNGMMGVVEGSDKVPWYLSWPFLIFLILTGIGFIPALVLGALRGMSTKVQVVCPNCNHVLGPV